MSISVTRIVLPAVALAMGLLGFFHVQQESQSVLPAAPPESPPRCVYDHAIAGTGVVEAQTENIAIGAGLTGLVLEVHVPASKVGQRVTQGDPLFRVDDRHLRAQLGVANAQLASAQAFLAKLEKQPRAEELPVSESKVRTATAKVALCEDQYLRGKRLVGGDTISQEEFMTRQLTYEAAVHEQAQAQAEYDLLKAGAWKPDLAIAAASVQEAQAKVDQLKTEIDRALVTASVDGIVLQVNVRPGERISELDTRPIMVLGGTATMHVRIDIDERDIPRYRPGSPAKAYPRGASARELSLRFVRVEPYVVPKKSLTGDNTERVDTRVLQVIYAIEGTNASVYVGQQLDVFLRSER
jgi:multidrug resistance efflux pump